MRGCGPNQWRNGSPANHSNFLIMISYSYKTIKALILVTWWKGRPIIMFPRNIIFATIIFLCKSSSDNCHTASFFMSFYVNSLIPFMFHRKVTSVLPSLIWRVLILDIYAPSPLVFFRCLHLFGTKIGVPPIFPGICTLHI